jgi:hypothetical protein
MRRMPFPYSNNSQQLLSKSKLHLGITMSREIKYWSDSSQNEYHSARPDFVSNKEIFFFKIENHILDDD